MHLRGESCGSRNPRHSTETGSIRWLLRQKCYADVANGEKHGKHDKATDDIATTGDHDNGDGIRRFIYVSMTTAVDNTSTKSKNVRNKLFLTTSDLMTTMNKALEDLGGSEQQDNSIIRPHVELQRRMPDGSTRPASEKDLETADMESKLRQVMRESEFRYCHLKKDVASHIFVCHIHRLDPKLRI